ncbi:LPS assembly lipoprotein LptE [Paludibacterium yongneupense]|uniref:LPS-assembly lipoprotein LptE n=1 Tax=Paludibacterium yongneupense TaxID=400061 RepID=UPI0003FFC0A4|nr:LPS assembly lipoprotein LptE [Paludibacterium yongneupense]
MTRHFAWLVSLLLVLTLSACGFHLRGIGGELKPLSFKTLYIGGRTTGSSDALRKMLMVDPRVTLVDSPSKADAVLTFTDEQQSRQLSTIDKSGKANEYMLSYRIVFNVTLFGQEQMPITLNSHRSMTYSDSDVLGKAQEEAMLWNDMHVDTARLVVYRMQALKPQASADASGPHAVVKP